MREIIDSHFHLWDIDRFHYPWLSDAGAEALRWDYLPADFAADIGPANVVAAVHVQAELDHTVDPVTETAWIAELQQTTDLVPTVCVGYADIRSPELADLLDRHAQYEAFRGIRQEAWFDPHSTRADVPTYNLLDDPAWVAGLSHVEQRDLVFDLLVWSSQLRQAASIFASRPGLRVVLEHTGVPVSLAADDMRSWREGLRVFADTVPGSVLKISALSFISPLWDLDKLRPVVHEALDIFGPQRCMFASNFPVDKIAVPYLDLWDSYVAMTSDLSNAEADALFSGTARRTYRIETTPLSTNSSTMAIDASTGPLVEWTSGRIREERS